MNIVIKHTLKNIFKKPFRSIVLMLCVMVTCLTAFLALDMSGTIGDIITGYMADMLGTVDVEIISTKSIDMAMFDELPECVTLTMDATSYPVATRDPAQYSYEYVKDFNIYGLDVESAKRMEMFKEDVDIKEGQIGISTTYAEMFDIKVGDVIDVYDENGETHPFEVSSILGEFGVFIAKDEYTGVLNISDMASLVNRDTSNVREMMIDVVNDDEIDNVCDYLEKEHPEFTVTRVKGNKQIQSTIDTLVMVFVILFVVTFLMVIFVTISLSEKIVNERMAVIGTMLSLGISKGVTTFILLTENIIYGLTGYVGGLIIYNMIRTVLFQGMIQLMEGSVRVTPTQTWVYIVVLIGALLVECAYPAISLIKTTKIAIRDIIFSNKDTEYKFSKNRLIAGIVMFVLGLGLSFSGVGVLMIISVVFVVVAMTFIMPSLIKFISGKLYSLFGKLNMPVAELAAKECGTKKNTVSNTVLCLTVAALSMAIIAISGGLQKISEYVSYDADIYMTGSTYEPEQYSYLEDIEGVTEIYYEHASSDMLKINGIGEDSDIIEIMAKSDQDIFVGIKDIPEDLGYDEVFLSENYCKKLGIKDGDTAEIKFKGNSLFPVTKQMKVIYANTTLYSSVPVMIVNADFFEDTYHDVVTGIYIRCESEDAVASVKEVIDKHTLDQSFITKTFAEWKQESEQEGASMQMAVTIAMIFGIGLAIIGISGNQTLGFEARRREYAVMFSTSMTKEQIKSLIFAETFISMGSSVLVGTALGVLLNWIIGRTVVVIDFPIQVTMSVGQYIGMAVVLVIVLLFTSMGPIRLLKKMNTAEELKYE